PFILSQRRPAGPPPLPSTTLFRSPRADAPSSEQIDRAAEVLDSAANPVVLAGHGAARAGAASALLRFAERLDVPVATTFHGKGRSEEQTSELQSRENLVCRLLLEK